MNGERFPELLTMGVSEARRYCPRDDREICISIRSPGEPPADLCSDFAAVLTLSFDDDSFAGWESRDNVIRPWQATEAIEFVERHRETASRLMIHCAMGASRSVSMALAFSKLYGDGSWRPRHWQACLSEGTIADAFIPNPGVYARIMDAHRRFSRARSVP